MEITQRSYLTVDDVLEAVQKNLHLSNFQAPGEPSKSESALEHLNPTNNRQICMNMLPRRLSEFCS